MTPVVITNGRERLVVRSGATTSTVHVDDVDLDVNITETRAAVEVLQQPTNVVEVQEERASVVTSGVGAQGPPGPVGGAYRHVQSVPDSVWEIEHDLGFFPAVTIVDSAGTQVEGDITHVSVTHVQATFSDAFAGSAFLS